MSKVLIEYDLSPAGVESEIRAKLIELGWQLPGIKPEQRKPLTDDEICVAIFQQVEELILHIDAFGEESEGIDCRIMAIARAVEAAHNIKEKNT